MTLWDIKNPTDLACSFKFTRKSGGLFKSVVQEEDLLLIS